MSLCPSRFHHRQFHLSATGCERKIAWPLLLVALVLTTFPNLSAQSNYTWNNVRIVAGGFVPGIVYHPNMQGLVYARTDIGGLYKSTNGGSNWTPLLDWVNWSNWGYSGVLSVALDPENADVIYAAVGAYTNSFDPNNGDDSQKHGSGQHLVDCSPAFQDRRKYARTRQWRAPGRRPQ